MSGEMWVSWRQWAADQITIHVLQTRLDNVDRTVEDLLSNHDELSSRVTAIEDKFAEGSHKRGRVVIWREVRYWGLLGLGCVLLAALTTWNIDRQLSMNFLDIAGKLALALL